MLGILCFLLVFGRNSANFNPVFSHKPFKLDREEFAEVIYEPLEVQCTESVCQGPLSPIYCHGELIANAWRLGLSQQCPGTKVRGSPQQVLDNYAKLKYPIHRQDMLEFCEKNFDKSTYLEVHELVDWKENPGFLKDIKHLDDRKLAEAIHNKWKTLSRRFIDDVHLHPDLYPIVPVNHSFVVPGGFFQTYFYWDSFWIIKGLLIGEMYETAHGMVQNFVDLVRRNGFIPNGGNLHLARRTQPPLFIQMVNILYEKNKNISMIRDWFPMMEKEFSFWMKNRSISFDTSPDDRHFMFIYNAPSDCPRPENFLSDYKFGTMSNRNSSAWKSFATACESGWDFSTRWFNHTGNNAFNKLSIRADTIIPVDLNVFMVINSRILSKFASLLDNIQSATYYSEMGTKLEKSIEKVMWNSTIGSWFDVEKSGHKHRTEFYPSNIYPLMLGITNSSINQQVKLYLQSVGILTMPGGVPSTAEKPSKEQWDFPNVWAPNQYFFIESLLISNDSSLKEIAHLQGNNFIDTVFKGLFNPPPGDPPGLWEKYDARATAGRAGGGGEYPVQEGFGWTNGAVLDLILRMDRQEKTDSMFGGPPHLYILLGVLFLISVLAMWFTFCGCTDSKICCFSMRKNRRNVNSLEQPLLVDDDSDN